MPSALGKNGGGSALDWLLAPVPAARFERDHYEQRPCLVARNSPGYYGDLLGMRELDTLLRTHSIEPRDINLVKSGSTIAGAEYTTEQGRVDPLAIARLFDNGATVILSQLQHRIPALAELCVAVGEVFSSRVQTNVYLTPPGSRGFDPHWDTHDVFVLQVTGRKNWLMHGTQSVLPLRGQRLGGPDSERSPKSDRIEAQLELKGGDALYIPRGHVHSARSAGEASLHITLGVTGFTWADFLLEGVAAAALDDAALRRNLPMGFATGRISDEEKERHVREKLDVLLSRFEAARVWALFEKRAASANETLPAKVLGSLAGTPAGLTADTRVRRRVDVWSVVPGSDSASWVVRFGDREVEGPGNLYPAVEFVAGADGEFTARDLPVCVELADRLAVVRRMVVEGLLEIAET